MNNNIENNMVVPFRDWPVHCEHCEGYGVVLADREDFTQYLTNNYCEDDGRAVKGCYDDAMADYRLWKRDGVVACGECS